MKARGRIRTDADGMNKTERAYAARLEAIRQAGGIHSYRFEAIKLRIGKACFYTPDFWVIRTDGMVEIHEVKGFWRDDARVKVRAVAAMFPEITFRAVRWIKGEWLFEDF